MGMEGIDEWVSGLTRLMGGRAIKWLASWLTGWLAGWLDKCKDSPVRLFLCL
jgi:hypothetical protein